MKSRACRADRPHRRIPLAQSSPATPKLRACLAAAALLSFAPSAAWAQGAGPAEANQPTPGQTGAQPATGLWERSNLLGDIGGLRTTLDGAGIQLGLTETSEVLGNGSGGRARGVIYDGLTEMSLGMDFGRAIGLDGGTFNVSALQLHGRGLTTTNVPSLAPISNIEANATTRLFELWYQQSFLGGKLDVKAGQQSADLEFMTTLYGALFVNASFGWPTLPGADLPAGGPAYPLSALAVRLRAHPTDDLTVLVAAFNGSPAGLGPGDPQLRNPSGTNFDADSGLFVIGEAQYAANPGGLPGTYKLGGWYNSNTFPAGAMRPTRLYRGDWSAYAVIDQLVYRPDPASDGGAWVLLRAMGAPGARNQVDAFVDGGVSWKGVFGRDNDTAGLGFGWTRISAAARSTDLLFRRSSEFLLEATYQAQVTPWWSVQPDVQYVFSPGAGIADPNRPGRRMGDAAVFGVRTSITF
jgi:porin